MSTCVEDAHDGLMRGQRGGRSSGGEATKEAPGRGLASNPPLVMMSRLFRGTGEIGLPGATRAHTQAKWLGPAVPKRAVGRGRGSR
jgi:hypothetical protein